MNESTPNQTAPASGVVDVEAIRRRFAEASQGPYEFWPCNDEFEIAGSHGIIAETSGSSTKREANATFFAHSWQDIAALLTTLAARDAEIERLEAEHLERDREEATYIHELATHQGTDFIHGRPTLDEEGIALTAMGLKGIRDTNRMQQRLAQRKP